MLDRKGSCMRYVWSRFILLVLVIEVVAFAVYYQIGPSGMQDLQRLRTIKIATQDEIASMKTENSNLQQQIEVWQADSFLQEKFAREKLALQKKDEIIFFKT